MNPYEFDSKLKPIRAAVTADEYRLFSTQYWIVACILFGVSLLALALLSVEFGVNLTTFLALVPCWCTGSALIRSLWCQWRVNYWQLKEEQKNIRTGQLGFYVNSLVFGIVSLSLGSMTGLSLFTISIIVFKLSGWNSRSSNILLNFLSLSTLIAIVAGFLTATLCLRLALPPPRVVNNEEPIEPKGDGSPEREISYAE